MDAELSDDIIAVKACSFIGLILLKSLRLVAKVFDQVTDMLVVATQMSIGIEGTEAPIGSAEACLEVIGDGS